MTQASSNLTSPRNRGSAKSTILGLILVAGVAGGGWWYFTQRGDSGSASAVRTSDITKAALSNFDVTTTASGELQALDQIEVRSTLEQQATIVNIIEEGTTVKKGEVLCVLNTDNLETELDTEEADLESSQAALFAAENAYQIQVTENESAIRDAELKLRLAQLTLQQWDSGDRVMKLQELDLNIDEANRELTRFEAKFEKNVGLLAEGFISKDQYDQDELALVKARARVKTVELQKQSYIDYEQKKDREQMESDVAQAQAQLENVKAQNEIKLADKSADRASANRRVVRDQARVDKLKQQIAASTITAPSDGMAIYGTTIMQSRNRWSSEGPLMIGQSVYPNQLLFSLPDTSKLVAEVRVHESLAGRIHKGIRANVKVDALPGVALTGTVREIGVLAESGNWRDPNLREYTVKILLDNNEHTDSLKPSMRCEASLLLDTVSNALAVPVAAIFNDGPVRYVYKPKGAYFERIPIQTGRFSETYAEILAGIEQGDDVLLRQPTAGEIIDKDWNQAELELVGLTLDEEGNPVRPMPAGMNGGAQPAAFQQGGQAQPQMGGKDGLGQRPQRGNRQGGATGENHQGSKADSPAVDSTTETTATTTDETNEPESETVTESPVPADKPQETKSEGE
ncbi:MAG: HlyD family efflux transporter periplasmic adaptor subunit [Phycisphaerales bacterium]|nr:HlyD family efflux transporter periplasmic adaptor subunit [Phycisphaerales bacterium]MCB9837636.1 HlyD family efflux transporter periplasmic adaptor subunit [Phycisphaera sp.]